MLIVNRGRQRYHEFSPCKNNIIRIAFFFFAKKYNPYSEYRHYYKVSFFTCMSLFLNHILLIWYTHITCVRIVETNIINLKLFCLFRNTLIFLCKQKYMDYFYFIKLLVSNQSMIDWFYLYDTKLIIKKTYERKHRTALSFERHCRESR